MIPHRSTSHNIIVLYVISGVPCQINLEHYDNHGSLTRYAKLWVAHAPGMPGTFSPPPISKEIAILRSRHGSRHVRDARAVMHGGVAKPRWRGKRSSHSRRMRSPQLHVSGKRSMGQAGRPLLVRRPTNYPLTFVAICKESKNWQESQGSI